MTVPAIAEAGGLPGLIDRAGQRLLAARGSAEVLEARALAETALHYAKVTKAANETHADCIRIITRAEMRMADEIDRGQASGEVRTRADNQHVQGPDKLEDLGIDRRRVADWRDVRDAGPEVVEEAIQGALAQGRAPTKAAVRKAAAKRGRRAKPQRRFATAPVETQHDRDLRLLQGAWGAACESARRAFLDTVGMEIT